MIDKIKKIFSLRLNEKERASISSVRMQSNFPPALDTTGFRKITASPFQAFEDTQFTREHLLALAKKLSEFDPIANQIVAMPINAMVSAGITITAEDDSVQEIIDEFWINKQFPQAGFQNVFIKNSSKSLIRSLFTIGSLYLPVGVDDLTGKVDIGFIEPLNVEDIIQNKGNPLVWEKLILKGNSTNNSKSQSFNIIRLTRNEFGEQMIDGEVFVFTVNHAPNSVNGKSVLCPMLKQIEAFSKTLLGETNRAALLRMFLWDVTLHGMGQGQINKWLNDNFPEGTSPTPNMLNAHNEKVTWNVQTPKLNQADFTHLIDQIFNYIVNGWGLPGFWMGFHGDTTNATAKEMAQAGVWTIEGMQRTVDSVLTTIISFVVNKAAQAGRVINGVKITESTDLSFKVILGRVRDSDLSQSASALSSIQETLEKAETMGYINFDQAQQIFVSQLNNTFNTELEIEQGLKQNGKIQQGINQRKARGSRRDKNRGDRARKGGKGAGDAATGARKNGKETISEE